MVFISPANKFKGSSIFPPLLNLTKYSLPSLNTETVTDDDAYQDAMNEYNYSIDIEKKR